MVDDHSAGELEEEGKRVYTIVIDSKNELKTTTDVLRTIRALREVTGGNINYLSCDDRLGWMVKRLLEYETRMNNS